MPAMFLCADKRIVVLADILEAVRPGTLYSKTGTGEATAIAL